MRTNKIQLIIIIICLLSFLIILPISYSLFTAKDKNNNNYIEIESFTVEPEYAMLYSYVNEKIKPNEKTWLRKIGRDKLEDLIGVKKQNIQI